MDEIAKKWRKGRLSIGLGQKELSHLIGIGQGYISDIERGRRKPSEHLERLFELTIRSHTDSISSTKSGTAPVDELDMFNQVEEKIPMTPEHQMLNTVLKNGSASQIEEVMGIISRVQGDIARPKPGAKEQTG